MSKVPPYLTSWRPDPDEEAHLRSARAVARFALTSPDLTPKHRIRLLNDAIWYRTEAVSKIRLRYRSGGVRALSTSGSSSWRSMLRHDHVQTRAALVRQMTEHPEDVERILGAAVACLVTTTEHQALGRYDTRAEGWDRYRMAGVDVYDFCTDPPTPIVINESANPVAP
jgi:hypothetical protein